MQHLEGNCLVVSKLTWGIWPFLTRALESLKNFYFNELLLRKVYIDWAKSVKGSYLSWHWRVMQNLKRNLLVLSKVISGIWQILTRALKSLENLHFNAPFSTKVYKYRVMFDRTDDWCKIWRKTDLCFQKWHEEFGKFSQVEKWGFHFRKENGRTKSK